MSMPFDSLDEGKIKGFSDIIVNHTLSASEMEEYGFFASISLENVLVDKTWIDNLLTYVTFLQFVKDEGSVISNLLEKYDIPNYFGVVFFGTRGTGKRTIAQTLAADIVTTVSDFNRVISIDSHDIDSVVESKVDYAHFIEMLFYHGTSIDTTNGKKDSDKKAVIVLEYPEYSKDAETLFFALDEKYRCLSDDDSVPVLIIVTKNSIEKYAAIEERFIQCNVSLPSDASRLKYMKKEISFLQISDNDGRIIIDDMDDDELINLTQGMNFNQLNSFIKLAKMACVQKVLQDDAFKNNDFKILNCHITGDEARILFKCVGNEKNDGVHTVQTQYIPYPGAVNQMFSANLGNASGGNYDEEYSHDVYKKDLVDSLMLPDSLG